MRKLKLKGAYWWPKDFQEALDTQSAHKDYNPTVVQRAAVAAMVDGISPETFIRAHTDPFDFMLRVKTNRGAILMWGDQQTQGTTRYYIARNGRPLTKVAPPPEGFEIGQYKRAAKVSRADYDAVMAQTGGEWDARVCTQNKSKYDNVTSNIQAGWLTQECNDMSSFAFDNINYQWYIDEAMKLII